MNGLGDAALDAPGGKSIETGTAEFIHGAAVDCGGELTMLALGPTNGIDGIFAHDPSTVTYLLDPQLFVTDAWPIRVETERFSRGETWPNLGIIDESTPPAWQRRLAVNVCTEVVSERAVALIEERLVAGA
jgi:inosine-uridine nucleoside N-ribohydrolase